MKIALPSGGISRELLYSMIFTAQGIGYHDVFRTSSGQAKMLSDVGEFAAASDLYIRIHGGLMLASWIGTASIGILLARYYKQTWVNSLICGKDQWFAVSYNRKSNDFLSLINRESFFAIIITIILDFIEKN